MAKSLEKFKKYCLEHQIDIVVQEFPEGTRTSVDAAQALKTAVGNIVKSILFLVNAEPVLVLMTGDKRVSVQKLAQTLSVNVTNVTKADADTTREITGYPVGGIPPFGHDQPLKTLMDVGIPDKAECFVAAGTPDSIFALSGSHLQELTCPIVDNLAE